MAEKIHDLYPTTRPTRDPLDNLRPLDKGRDNPSAPAGLPPGIGRNIDLPSVEKGRQHIGQFPTKRS